MSVLSKKYFHDEEAAFAKLESIVWPEGPVCPHCGNADGKRIYKIAANPEKRVRYGLHKCAECRKQFTAKVGTVFEHLRIPLYKALQAVYLMCASKKGISANQLHRVLEVTPKTAWFLAHRIREAMRSGDLSPMGGNGGIVEIDETYIGKKDSSPNARQGGPSNKHAVLTLVDRTGTARSFHVDKVNQKTVLPIIRKNLSDEARVVTDDAGVYFNLDREYPHAFVRHSRGEYGRGEVHTNTVEGFYSIFKRGMKGVYQHCSEKHLHRYLAEFDFRYSNRVALGVDDLERANKALLGVAGRRLKYA